MSVISITYQCDSCGKAQTNDESTCWVVDHRDMVICDTCCDFAKYPGAEKLAD